MFKRFFLTASALLLSVVWGGIAFTSAAIAESTSDASSTPAMSVQPSSQVINLTPGETARGSVTVSISSGSFDFEVESVPFYVDPATNTSNFSDRNDFTKLANWVKFKETKYQASKKKSATIEFEIEVPSGVAGGGQYAAIIIRPIQNSNTEGSSNITLVPQIASIINGHVDGPEARAAGSIVSHSLPSFILGNFSLTSTFKNTGNIDLEAYANLRIYDFFTGQEVFNPESLDHNGGLMGTVSATVYPGTTAKLEQYWDNAPQLGIYRIAQTITYNDDVITEEKLVFICPIWLLLLVLAFVLLFIIWLVVRIIEHKKEKPQVF